MPQPRDPSPDRYEIEVAVRLGARSREAFPGFEIRDVGLGSRLVGVLPDQAALHGVIARLRDLGLPLVSVRRLAVDGDDADPPGGAEGS